MNDHSILTSIDSYFYKIDRSVQRSVSKHHWLDLSRVLDIGFSNFHYNLKRRQESLFRLIETDKGPIFDGPSETCRQWWTGTLDNTRGCLRERWTRRKGAKLDVNSCIGWKLRNHLNKITIRNESPFYFIPPKLETWSGILVSLGVADNIGIEQNVYSRYPNWHFYGLDQNSQKRKLYETVGVFYESNLTSRNKGDINLVQFISSLLKRVAVDYLLINNGPMAVTVLPQLAKYGPIEHNGIAVCQVTVPIHLSYSDPNKNLQLEQSIQRIVKDLTVNGSWVPLHFTMTNEECVLFLVNSVSLYCLDKFFSVCQ